MDVIKDIASRRKLLNDLGNDLARIRGKLNSMSGAITVREYIDKEYNGNQRQFAAAIGVQPSQVTRWINGDFLVVDHYLYSLRRDLKTGSHQ